jgi:starch phosphorylase
MDSFKAEIPNNFRLPRRINRLGDLAYNLWWTWNPDAQRLFIEIDRALWERTNHNPIRFLSMVQRAQLNTVTQNHFYLETYDRIFEQYDNYMNTDDTWCSRNHPEYNHRPIAYFSSEFGLHETLPIYAGGLGILSGDHLKGASDLGLPLVAIGFLYTHGYFSQRITEDGWQEAHYLRLKFSDLPIIPIVGTDDEPLTVSVELPGREVQARLWEIHVGRVRLYLLDSDVEGNSVADRELTARLYTSDLDSRISQEIILGIGGVRALRSLGYNPSVFHLNEGHSAFLNLERAREMIASGHSFEEANERICNSSIFTTHTPVPAGNDEFPEWLIEKYFSSFLPDLELDREQFFNLGRNPHPWGNTFSMPILAFQMSRYRNGVSELHGQVAREMWHHLWPDVRVDDVPITHITNGAHSGTWLARRMRYLFDEYMGENWMDALDENQVWDAVENIPDVELWEVRRHLKRKLVHYMRERARDQWLNDSVHPVQVVASGVLLDPYALTIGFARRFATYKRANLILRDLDRLLDIINRPNMPVQIIFAGKSHPADEPGKMLIQEVYRIVKKAENGGRLVFLEDYDMNLSRYLLQGVDVWLNTPRRPHEASGTSGMKAAMNGVVNFSVLDGWWREGYNGNNGWAIGRDVDYDNPNQQDEEDAISLYDILENQIIPLYYKKRSSDGLPGEWIAVMKESIRTLSPQFSMRRMVKEYVEQLYVQALQAENIKHDILN